MKELEEEIRSELMEKSLLCSALTKYDSVETYCDYEISGGGEVKEISVLAFPNVAFPRVSRVIDSFKSSESDFLNSIIHCDDGLYGVERLDACDIDEVSNDMGFALVSDHHSEKTRAMFEDRGISWVFGFGVPPTQALVLPRDDHGFGKITDLSVMTGMSGDRIISVVSMTFGISKNPRSWVVSF